MTNGFAWAALLLSIAAYFPYMRGVLKHGKRPKKASWLIFLVVNSVILSAMFFAGQIAWQVVAYEVGIFLTFLLSLRYGEPGWSRADFIVLGIALAAIVLWFLTSAITAIALSLVASYVGTVPMWVALWKNPDSEPRLPWVLFGLGSICYFASLGPPESWSLAATLGPAGYFLQQISLLVLGIPSRR